MGQYFKAVNKTKKEVVCPWCLHSGAKLWEWSANPIGAIFTLLLRQSDHSGGGDYYGYATKVVDTKSSEGNTLAETLMEVIGKEGAKAHPAPDTIVGRWAGDEVVLVGDYDSSGLYEESDSYRNISQEVAEAWNDYIEIKEMTLSFHPLCPCQEKDSG